MKQKRDNKFTVLLLATGCAVFLAIGWSRRRRPSPGYFQPFAGEHRDS